MTVFYVPHSLDSGRLADATATLPVTVKEDERGGAVKGAREYTTSPEFCPGGAPVRAVSALMHAFPWPKDVKAP